VLDLAEACAFYRDKLGFQVAFIYEDFYASVERDGIALHLKLSDEPDPGHAFKHRNEHLDVYIATDRIQALYEEYQNRGVAFLQPLHNTDWGTQEFVVEDNSGYILYFAQEVTSVSLT
jgi:uncharacterized glyoxalase superfamily protein PhnB